MRRLRLILSFLYLAVWIQLLHLRPVFVIDPLVKLACIFYLGAVSFSFTLTNFYHTGELWVDIVARKVIGGKKNTAAGRKVEPIFIVKQLHFTAVVQQRMDDSCSNVNTFCGHHTLTHSGNLEFQLSFFLGKGREIWREIYLIQESLFLIFTTTTYGTKKDPKHFQTLTRPLLYLGCNKCSNRLFLALHEMCWWCELASDETHPHRCSPLTICPDSRAMLHVRDRTSALRGLSGIDREPQ